KIKSYVASQSSTRNPGIARDRSVMGRGQREGRETHSIHRILDVSAKTRAHICTGGDSRNPLGIDRCTGQSSNRQEHRGEPSGSHKEAPCQRAVIVTLAVELLA